REREREKESERETEKLTEKFSREFQVTYETTTTETTKKKEAVLFQDPQIQQLPPPVKSKIEQFLEKYRGVTAECARDILGLLKDQGLSQKEMAAQCKKLALAAVNFKALQSKYPEFSRFVFLPQQKKIKLVLPYLQIKTS
ncbi:MAG: hypothetical protein CO189_10490, partial [candidate division Zixibacteria bacterium CG_4_9_14_3_um_filter_46_8]